MNELFKKSALIAGALLIERYKKGPNPRDFLTNSLRPALKDVPVATEKIPNVVELSKKGTECLPCGKWHLKTIQGALGEALRFARAEGMASPEVVRRINIAGSEVVDAERIDFAPSNIVSKPTEEKRVAEWAVDALRNLRHGLDELDKDPSVDNLQGLAAKAQNYSEEYQRKLWEIAPPKVKTVFTAAQQLKSGEITKDEAVKMLRETN